MEGVGPSPVCGGQNPTNRYSSEQRNKSVTHRRCSDAAQPDAPQLPESLRIPGLTSHQCRTAHPHVSTTPDRATHSPTHPHRISRHKVPPAAVGSATRKQDPGRPPSPHPVTRETLDGKHSTEILTRDPSKAAEGTDRGRALIDELPQKPAHTGPTGPTQCPVRHRPGPMDIPSGGLGNTAHERRTHGTRTHETRPRGPADPAAETRPSGPRTPGPKTHAFRTPGTQILGPAPWLTTGATAPRRTPRPHATWPFTGDSRDGDDRGPGWARQPDVIDGLLTGTSPWRFYHPPQEESG